MKVYDWKTLLVSVIVGGGMLVYKLFHIQDIIDIAWIAFWCYLIFQGLRISLSKDGYEAEQNRIKNSKELHQKMVDKYGKISYVLLYAPYVFLVLAILLVLIIPNKDWAVITGLISFGLFVALIIIDKIIENNIKSK